MDPLPSLITRIQDGDLKACGTRVYRFQDMAVGYACTIIGDLHHAEDAAQEAFLNVYQDLDHLRKPEAFPAWFRQIVFKHCDRFTRRKR
ncbi:MAG: sigma factor [Gemmatimonadota bacterium]|nr:sigma factor [Gemmatimonadota bacterium]